MYKLPTYNHHNKNTKINENHSSLDRKSPSMLAITEKYKRTRTSETSSTQTRKIMDYTKGELKCAQINLQHSRVATANLMKYTADNKVDIICIQEPYIHQGRAAGIDTQ